MPHRLPRLAATFAIAGMMLGLVSHAAPSQATPMAGRPVHEVLRELQQSGIRLVFASSLVTADLRVQTEPRSKDARAIALEILAPHQLTLRRGPGTTWLVVRAPRAPAVPRATPAPPATVESSTRIEQDEDTLRVHEEVTVSQASGDLASQPAAYTIAPSQVLATAGVLENVLQALTSLPGVTAIDDRNGGLSVRGAGPEYNILLLDGAPIYYPQRASDFGASFLNPETIGSLALDASGLDARYGGRLSSTTVVETRDGLIDRRLAMSASVGLTSGDLLVEGRLPGTTTGSWWAAVRGTYYKFVADRFNMASVPGFVDGQFKVAVSPTPQTRLSVFALVGNEAMTQRLMGEPDPRSIAGDIEVELDTTNVVTAANLRWTPGERLTLLTTGTLYRHGSRYQDNWIRPATGLFNRQIEIDDVAVRQRASFMASDRHLLDAGIEIRHTTGEWLVDGAVIPPYVRPVGPDVWGNERYPRGLESQQRLAKTVVSTWLQDRIALPAGLSIEPGLRLDRHSFTDEIAVQPRLRVGRTFRRADVWAGLAWQAQPPGLETMQQGFTYFDFTAAPPGSLRVERSRQIVAGVQHAVSAGTTLRVEGYRRLFDHLLVQRLESDAEREARISKYLITPEIPLDSAFLEHRPTAVPESTGTGSAWGVEVLLQRHTGWLTGWASYTLSRAQRDLYGMTVPFDFDRRHAVGLALQASVRSNVRIAVTSKYASGFPITPLHDEPFYADYAVPTPPPGQQYRPAYAGTQLHLVKDVQHPLRLSLLNSSRLPAYARTDARVEFDIGRHTTVYGEMINLMDRHNFEPLAQFGSIDSEQPLGRYAVAQRIPRLLSYGIRVRF